MALRAGADPQLPGRRGHELDAGRRPRARRDRRARATASSSIRGCGLRNAQRRRRPIDVGNAGTLMRLLPGLAGIPGGRELHARRRRVDPPPAGRPDRRAAAADGRRDRGPGRTLPAVHRPRRAAARDRIRAPGGQRPGEVVRAAGRPGHRTDDGDRARRRRATTPSGCCCAAGADGEPRAGPRTAARTDGRQRRRARAGASRGPRRPVRARRS